VRLLNGDYALYELVDAGLAATDGPDHSGGVGFDDEERRSALHADMLKCLSGLRRRGTARVTSRTVMRTMRMRHLA
jgi:hypothetical protein